MPLTPEQIAKIRQKEATTADALKRDPLTDYREGWFFVTLNTRGEAPILSTVEGRVGATGADAPHCRYTELGEKVMEAIASINKFHKGAEVEGAEAMPEHLHILLHLLPGNKEHLGKIVGGFMGGCSHAYWDTLGIDWRKNHPTQGAVAQHTTQQTKQQTTDQEKRHSPYNDRDRDHTRSFRGPALFTRGYNDVEALTPEQVEIKREYIRKQAEKRLIQGDRHVCFAIHRHAHSPNWTLDRAMGAVSADCLFSHNAQKCLEAQKRVEARLNTDKRGICLDYLGYPPLMTSEHKLPLICHRADAKRFEEQKQAVMEAARAGWVIVSAFISPKERDIMKLLMTEMLPFIEIMDNGFSERYKPSGKAFYACAENRLLQITPWSYSYQKEVTVSREMCLVMNELVRLISGRSDDWWKNTLE